MYVPYMNGGRRVVERLKGEYIMYGFFLCVVPFQQPPYALFIRWSIRVALNMINVL